VAEVSRQKATSSAALRGSRVIGRVVRKAGGVRRVPGIEAIAAFAVNSDFIGESRTVLVRRVQPIPQERVKIILDANLWSYTGSETGDYGGHAVGVLLSVVLLDSRWT